jgi:hypothetical protein
MLLVAFLAGTLSAPRWSAAVGWLALSVLLALVAREPAVLWLRAARRGRPARGALWVALAEGAAAAALARAAWFLARPARRLDLRRIGYLEMAYSLVFLVLLVLAFRPA